MISRLSHQFIEWTCLKNHKEFLNASRNIELAQKLILQRLAGTSDYEKFKILYPVTSYSDWSTLIEEKRVKEKGKIQFVPSSGSTQKIKWIPYTQNFKKELWRATAPWIYDLYKRYPEIKRGTHFWSLSWLPEDMRKDYQTNDLDFFVGLEKVFLSNVMTMPASVAYAETLENSMREALVSLLTKKVTLISVWSPTFLLELLNYLMHNKNIFIKHVNENSKKFFIESDKTTPELTKLLFPDLILISSWGTSTSAYYAGELKKLFPKVSFEEKGLWATEGVVTIPYQGRFPLAVNSHFYEFIVEETREIKPSWALEQGMKVIPLLTTGSGFIRYQLNDLLEVDGFYNQAPCFKFLGRINEVDLVGEKISAQLAEEILKIISSKFKVAAISLIAFVKPHAHYQILIDGEDEFQLSLKIKEVLEEQLMLHFHYKLARELNQLSEVEVHFSENAINTYLSYSEKQVAIRGNIKIEPLLLVRG